MFVMLFEHPILFMILLVLFFFFFFQAEDGIRDRNVTGVQTCALPILPGFRSLCVRLRRRDRRARCDDHRQAAGDHRAGHTRRRDARLRGAASRVALLRRHHGIEAHGMTLPPRRTFADREEVLGAVMLAPALAYVILLVGVPFVFAILLGFSNATAGSLSFGWAGLHNYRAILDDPIFLRALRNSVI